MERKRYVQIAAVVIAVLILGSALYSYVYLPSLPRELTKVRIAHLVAPQDGYWEIPYANYTEIYREEGLQVEITIVRSPKEMTQALLAGDVDFSFGMGELLRAYLGGVDQIRIVSVMQLSSFALFVKPEINSIRDVKSIAIQGGGPNDSSILVNEYLIQHGLKPGVDISIVPVAGIPMLAPAFLAGEVDAFISGVSSYKIVRTGEAKILVQFAKEFPKWYMGGIGTTEKMIVDKPEVVKAFVKASYLSQVSLMKNREKAIEFAVDVLGLDKDYATFVYEFAYEGKYGVPTKIIPGMPVEDLKYTWETSTRYMGVPAKPIEGCFDTRFMEQVKKELG